MEDTTAPIDGSVFEKWVKTNFQDFHQFMLAGFPDVKYSLTGKYDHVYVFYSGSIHVGTFNANEHTGFFGGSRIGTQNLKPGDPLIKNAFNISAYEVKGKRVIKGIDMAVYSHPQFRGCANGGITARFDKLLIAHERGYLELTGDEENLVKLVCRKIGGRDVFHLTPIDDVGQYMMGGSFAYSPDNRFHELTGIYGALPIHDRIE